MDDFMIIGNVPHSRVNVLQIRWRMAAGYTHEDMPAEDKEAAGLM